MSKKNIYPANWKSVSLRIRVERAQGQCECTGECRLHDGRCERRQGDPTSNPTYTVTLTVAHLDADGGPCQCLEETGMKCANEEHLRGMCNRCHLVYDMPHHVRNAKATRTARKDAARPLFSELEVCNE